MKRSHFELLILLALNGCPRISKCLAPSNSCEAPNVEESVSLQTATYEVQAVRVREASPNQNFNQQPVYIGCSADGFDRTIVQFPNLSELVGHTIVSAELRVEALSGTCASSYDRTICDLGMTINGYVASPYIPIDLATVTWKTQPELGLLNFDSTIFTPTASTYVSLSEDYQQAQTTDNGIFTIDITSYVTEAAKPKDTDSPYDLLSNSIILMVDFDHQKTRDEQIRLNGEFQIGRALQRDLIWNPLDVIVKYTTN
ncbi:MAG: DNRLRE domain-containing protein [Candidatus Woesearchaeota archaeon]|jgi:hypothetical protein